MTLTKNNLTRGSVLLMAVVASNFLNFLFNAILGRWLSFENFSLVTLVITFYYVSSIFTNALSATMNFSVSKLLGDGKTSIAQAFFNKLTKNSLIFSVGLVIAWLLLIPALQRFFHVDSATPFLAFAPLIIFSTYTYDVIGYLQGCLRFVEAAAVIVTEPIMKLISGVVIVLVGFGANAYVSLPISLVAAATVGIVILHTKSVGITRNDEDCSFPRRFFFTTLGMSVGSILFFSIDLMLVRHFFSSEISGQYAIVSLIGKMMYFFTTILNIFTISLASRARDQFEVRRLLKLLVLGTGFLATSGWLALGLFGSRLVPLLFGDKVMPILSLLPVYTLGIALYALAGVIVSFHLARQDYLLSYCQIASALLMGLLIIFRHENLSQITTNIALTGGLLLASVIVLRLTLYFKRIAYAT